MSLPNSTADWRDRARLVLHDLEADRLPLNSVEREDLRTMALALCPEAADNHLFGLYACDLALAISVAQALGQDRAFGRAR